MKKSSQLAIACALALTAAATTSFAEEANSAVSLSANVALTSDYVWRGVSQTDTGPAIQGGFDIEHESGVYAGVWGSNVNFGIDDDADIEIDVYLGWATELDNGVGIDLGVNHFDFPSVSDYDTEEFYLGASYSYFSGTVNYNEDYMYYDLGAEVELPNEFTLAAHYGIWDADDWEGYEDWSISVSKSLFEVDFTLAYSDTDMNDDDTADGRAVFTAAKSF